MNDDTTTNSCINWRDINSLDKWKYKIIKINYAGQLIFNSTNFIMLYEFVQNKFIKKFITLSLLI